MKFVLSSTALSSRLNTLVKVINSKNSLSILDSILFTINNGVLSLTASDGENTMRTTLKLDDSDANGSFCVPNRTIIDSVRELPEQPLTFEVDMDSLAIKVTFQDGFYNFTAINGDEFPIAQTVADTATTLTLPAKVLNDNLTRSIFATAQDELRPVMNGVYFDLTSEALAVVASDGHKLVRNKVLTIKSDNPSSFILPKKPALLLKNVLAHEEANIIIRYDERNAEFAYSDGQLSCRLIEGKYPNYNSVIPENNPNLLTIERKTLLGAIRRVVPFANDSNQLVRFHLTAGNLELTSEDIEFATSAKVDIVCDYNGMPMDIGFKGSSLNEILNTLESDEVTLALADPGRAGLILPVTQPEGEEVLMLIMPMLLNA